MKNIYDELNLTKPQLVNVIIGNNEGIGFIEHSYIKSIAEKIADDVAMEIVDCIDDLKHLDNSDVSAATGRVICNLLGLNPNEVYMNS